MKKYFLVDMISLLHTCKEIVASAERLRARGIDIQVNMQCLGSKKKRLHPVIIR